MKDLTISDHLPQPLTLLGRPLHRQKEGEEFVLLPGPPVLLQGLRQGEMARPPLRREAVGVGCQKSEGALFVLAVLREVEVDSSDHIPGRVEGLEKFGSRQPALRQRGLEGAPQLFPQVLEHL